jgi:MOSC domain-containing protein YiiM
MRGHGGVTAKVISSGELHVGDSASFVIAEAIIQKQSMLGF